MTIYDIAKEAGVSASTVSRVINNKQGIKKETKVKVQKILDKYDFHIDDNAKGLVTKSTKLVGILVSDIRKGHHNSISYIISNKLVEFGYCTIVINSGRTKEEIDKAINVLRQRKVDGIILIGSIFNVDGMKKTIKAFFSSTPVIMANGYFDLQNVYGIQANEYQGIRDGVRHLYSKGYKKIAFVGNLNTKSNQSKAKGYSDELKCLNKQKDTIILDLYNCENTFNKLKELFVVHSDIDSIIFSDDIILFNHLRFLQDLGKKIPDDLGLIGVNNEFFCTLTTPTLTTIDNKMKDTALAVVDTLIGVLKGETKEKQKMLFTSLIKRESTNKRST